MRPLASVQVLCVGDRDFLRLSFEMLLQSAGYSVISVSSDCALQGDIPRDLAIAIIGQTVNDFSASRIAASLRQTHPEIRTLRLTMQYSRSGPEFDRDCFIEDGPEVFLSCVAELLPPELTDEVAIHSRSGRQQLLCPAQELLCPV